MIRKAIAVLLTLAAVALLAGAIIDQWLPVHWHSRQHPRFAGRPILSLYYEPNGRPALIYHCDGPPGGPNLHSDFWFVAGVWIARGKMNCGMRIYEIHCPLWLPVVLLAAYPALAFARSPRRRWRRRREGRCLACGYDLTGNTSGVCPECGEAT